MFVGVILNSRDFRCKALAHAASPSNRVGHSLTARPAKGTHRSSANNEDRNFNRCDVDCATGQGIRHSKNQWPIMAGFEFRMPFNLCPSLTLPVTKQQQSGREGNTTYVLRGNCVAIEGRRNAEDASK